MSDCMDAYTALQRHIAAMRLKVLEQLAETSLVSLSTSDIDALEFHLEQDVRRPLRSLRNSGLPCNRIPPEVVTRIAHYCSSPTFDTPWYICLLKSTHLCHRWREIITSCPSLWTLIRAQPPEIAAIFLERSRDLPLDIYTLSDPCYEPTNLRRIRTLCLRTSGLRGLSELFLRLTVPSPVITEVIIDVTGSVHGLFPDLPPLFGDMSTIRSLSLDVDFDRKLLSFTSLTSLDISIFGVLLPPFLDLLAVNPTLEFISISVWGTTPFPKGQVDTPAIALNNLVTLHCRDASRYLLSRLLLPPSTSIQIEDTGFPLVLSRTLPTPIPNIRCLAQIDSLRLTTTSKATYSGPATNTHSVRLAGSGGSVDIHWIMGYDGPRRFDPQPLSLGYVKEMSITHETIIGDPRASELDLSLLFDAMKGLEVLRIRSCLPTDCHNILSPFNDNSICPSLHTVEIVHPIIQTQWLSALVQTAKRRHEAGLALRKVLISPHPDSDSPAQRYIRELTGVTLEPCEPNAV